MVGGWLVADGGFVAGGQWMGEWWYGWVDGW